jgi:hypothetical protein
VVITRVQGAKIGVTFEADPPPAAGLVTVAEVTAGGLAAAATPCFAEGDAVLSINGVLTRNEDDIATGA